MKLLGRGADTSRDAHGQPDMLITDAEAAQFAGRRFRGMELAAGAGGESEAAARCPT